MWKRYTNIFTIHSKILDVSIKCPICVSYPPIFTKLCPFFMFYAIFSNLFFHLLRDGRQNYLGQIYPAGFEIIKTTESNTPASYLDLLLSIGKDGQLHTSLFDKRFNFNFRITNFPFLWSNIPSSPAYDVFISHLILYARACSSNGCFVMKPGGSPVHYLHKLTWFSASNRRKWNFIVDTGIQLNNMKEY